MKRSGITITDQFCGAGGSSQGARRLGLNVSLAMNHWQLAVDTHNANFPDTQHDCADLRVVHPARYWSTDILLTSPECTNHSVAKGVKRRTGQLSFLEEEKIDPSAERSRATMWTVPEYAEHHNYEIIITENVVDARKWRPWDGWIQSMHNLGYHHEVVYFNSMFAHMRPLDNPRYGDFAPQSRDRMYVIFWKRGNRKPDLEIRPLAHCATCGKDVEAVQSWKKPPGSTFWKWGRYGVQYIYACPKCAAEVMPYYYCAANAIDWTIPAERIGDRNAPLKSRTRERISRGLDMFAGQHLVVDLSHTHGHDKRSVPVYRAGAQATAETSALMMVPPGFLMETLFTDGERRPKGMDEPMSTQTTRQSTAVVTTPFVLGYANGDGPPRDLSEPLRTFHTGNGQGLVVPPFVVSMRGTTSGMNRPVGIDEPIGTVSAGGIHHGLVAPPFLMSYYGSGASQRMVDGEMGTVTATDRHALVQPAGRVDVDDCGFRMLEPHEIGRGMAFDDGYIVQGTKRERVRQYGNAVTPPVMELLLERCVQSLI